VVLADASAVGRHAVAGVLTSLPDVALVREAATVDELARALRRDAPDVLVIDDRLLTEARLGLLDARLCVLVVGLDVDPSYAQRAARIGATAWIAKERADELLPEALDRARHARGRSQAWADATGPSRVQASGTSTASQLAVSTDGGSRRRA
jgi:DNA-binding NarL/FixJ family response regulator